MAKKAGLILRIEKLEWRISQREILPASLLIGDQAYCNHLAPSGSIAIRLTLLFDGMEPIVFPLQPICCAKHSWAKSIYFLAVRKILRGRIPEITVRRKWFEVICKRVKQFGMELPPVEEFWEIHESRDLIRRRKSEALNEAANRRRKIESFIASARKKNLPHCLTLLGFANWPTKTELHQRYLWLSKRVHPDVGGSAEEFRRIRALYLTAMELIETKSTE